MSIVIVTDSAANLPEELAARYDISVVPIYLQWDDRTYRDGLDIGPDEVYQRLRGSETFPKTAAPPPGDFLETYQKLGGQGHEILSIHLPTALSSVIQSARAAARLAAEQGISVQVLDTGTAAMAEGFVALAAARAAKRADCMEQVVRAAQAVRDRVRLYAVIDDLRYLQHSGRIGRAAALLGSVLQVRPIIFLNGGIVDVLARPRSHARALQLILDEMADQVKDHPVHAAVMHADAPTEASQLRARIEAAFHCVEILTTAFTPVMGVSVGPGLVGVAFYPEE